MGAQEKLLEDMEAGKIDSKRLWAQVVAETSGLAYAVRDKMKESAPEVMETAGIEGVWTAVAFLPLVGGYMGVARNAGLLLEALKETRAAEATYAEERNQLASKIFGMRDCSIATMQLADVSGADLIAADTEGFPRFIPWSKEGNETYVGGLGDPETWVAEFDALPDDLNTNQLEMIIGVM